MGASTSDIFRAVQLLRSGRLVAFPTETVYGLGADATNPAAIDLIYATKGRPGTNPLIVHVADVATARRLVTDWPAEAQLLAERFWPGPLTLVLPKNRAVVPDNVTAGLGTVALRVPNHPLALELLRAFGGPLAAPSANRSTHVSPTTARHVRDEFPESGGEPSLILDGGPCTVGIESTVLDLTTSPPAILRPGEISRAQIKALLGPVEVVSGAVDRGAAKSPGQQETHYSPRTPTFRFETSQLGLIPAKWPQGRSNGIVALSTPAASERDASVVVMPRDPAGYARELYGVLRQFDAMQLSAIYIEMPPDEPQWAAVRDRLTRASRPLPTPI